MRFFASTVMFMFVALACATSHGQEFLRGDANGDGRVSAIEDGLALLRYNFSDDGDEHVPPCLDSADANNNGRISLVDPLFLLSWGFLDGTAPPTPGVSACGEDTLDTLGCETPAPCPGDEPELEVDEAIVLSISSATVSDASVEAATLTVSVENGDSEILGFQFGMCHDSDVVCVAEGAFEDGGADAQILFAGYTVRDGAWGVGWVYNFQDGGSIPSGGSANVLTVIYSIMGEGTSSVAFCDYPNEHGWPVRVFTVDGTRRPAVEDGSITVTAFDGSGECTHVAPPPPPPPPVEPGPYDYATVGDCVVAGSVDEYTFSVGDSSGFLGGEVTLPVDLGVKGSCVSAWVLGLCFDTELLSYEGAVKGADVEVAGTLFFSTHLSSVDESNLYSVCVLDDGMDAFPEREDPYEILQVTFAIHSPFETTDITVCDVQTDDSNPMSPGVVHQGGGDTNPADFNDGTIFTSSGFVTLVPALSFERGDVDGNGVVSALTDTIYLLRWSFLEDDPPPCRDAADVNDDGAIVGIVDGLHLLQWHFAGGSAPRPPFGLCANDPTADNIGCVNPTPTCD